jgi:hypothetical protein
MRHSATTMPAGLIAVLLALAGLVGCGKSEQAPSYPDGAIRLRENIPTPVGAYRVIAAGIDGDRASVVIEPREGTPTEIPVTEGKRFSAAGLTLDVLDVVPPTNDDAAPGSSDGAIVILVVPS